jgi:hypothetical protein
MDAFGTTVFNAWRRPDEEWPIIDRRSRRAPAVLISRIS